MVVTGRLSLRDDKEPQIVVNRAQPISDFSGGAQPASAPAPQSNRLSGSTLYLRLPSERDPRLRKVRAMLNMFPGDAQAVVYFADTRIRRGTHCGLDRRLVGELENVLGNGNVVVK